MAKKLKTISIRKHEQIIDGFKVMVLNITDSKIELEKNFKNAQSEIQSLKREKAEILESLNRKANECSRLGNVYTMIKNILNEDKGPEICLNNDTHRLGVVLGYLKAILDSSDINSLNGRH